ncbi:ribbon-helix-helix protein, CopG family [Haloplanus rallus]|uniref:Ribbon-helix-helix protein, CopG family n=1 Tax=Haloplanus rallus TaxID=1816183 RepID=A0A6B9F6E7_9EURY|nr:ribbon-helix-helix protein, CopG family [Haloplanus rallus]QGX94992.1 ribbon-helix-helix protein, CopG family [Haloplanus rallus]
MASPSITVPDELLTKIDQQRARDAAETGDVQSRSEWFREAAREKLGIDYTNDNGPEESKGAA